MWKNRSYKRKKKRNGGNEENEKILQKETHLQQRNKKKNHLVDLARLRNTSSSVRFIRKKT